MHVGWSCECQRMYYSVRACYRRHHRRRRFVLHPAGCVRRMKGQGGAGKTAAWDLIVSEYPVKECGDGTPGMRAGRCVQEENVIETVLGSRRIVQGTRLRKILPLWSTCGKLGARPVNSIETTAFCCW